MVVQLTKTDTRFAEDNKDTNCDVGTEQDPFVSTKNILSSKFVLKRFNFPHNRIIDIYSEHAMCFSA